jgi:hypothetical protein
MNDRTNGIVGGITQLPNNTDQPFMEQPSVSSSSDSNEMDSNRSVSSVESARDRSHLFLDPKKMRSPAETTTDSPSLPKDILAMVNEMLSPERILGLPSTLQALANATAQHQQGATVAETPTPTKLIYPHTVTKAQEIFAEGFQQALRQIQFANNFVPPTPSLQSPSTANLLLPILAALTPTLSTAPSIVPVSSPLGSPVKPSVPAPTVSSETAQLPKPEQSQVPVPAQTASSGTFSVSSTSSAFGAVSPTATVASQQSPSVKSTESLTPSSDSSPLSEICKKLDPNT